VAAGAEAVDKDTEEDVAERYVDDNPAAEGMCADGVTLRATADACADAAAADAGIDAETESEDAEDAR
jgi:hypothetical protein